MLARLCHLVHYRNLLKLWTLAHRPRRLACLSDGGGDGHDPPLSPSSKKVRQYTLVVQSVNRKPKGIPRQIQQVALGLVSPVISSIARQPRLHTSALRPTLSPRTTCDTGYEHHRLQTAGWVHAAYLWRHPVDCPLQGPVLSRGRHHRCKRLCRPKISQLDSWPCGLPTEPGRVWREYPIKRLERNHTAPLAVQ